MSEEIVSADSLLVEIARLRTDLHEHESQLGQAHQALDAAERELAHTRTELDGVRSLLTAAYAEVKAERAARMAAEADVGWWHATVANYVTSATVGDREMLRDVLAEATTYPHVGAHFAAELTRARAAEADAAALRELYEDVERWRSSGGDVRELRYVLDTADRVRPDAGAHLAAELTLARAIRAALRGIAVHWPPLTEAVARYDEATKGRAE